MKKEYLILIAIIIFAGSYLFLHKENKANYKLPEIEKIDTKEVTEIILKKDSETITFTKEAEAWVLNDKKFAADPKALQDILDTLKTFKLTTLISLTNDLQRYELDKKKGINVKFLEKGKTLLEFTIGKPAPSFNHTFVMLANEKNIFHAKGSFRSNFDKTVDDFRDKKVLEFKSDSIKEVFIKKDGKSLKLVSRKQDKENKDSNKWFSGDKVFSDKKTVSDLLATISFLKCENFNDSFTKSKIVQEKPLCSILLNNNDKIKLTLYKSNDQESLTAISSMNDYVFSLSEFNSKEIISNIDKLLGIEKPLADKSK